MFTSPNCILVADGSATSEGTLYYTYSGFIRTDVLSSQYRKLERLDENMGAADVELTSDDLREIESAASKIKVQGSRLPDDILKMTGR
jgi:hypothetical protein